jgi:hypothetical protein
MEPQHIERMSDFFRRPCEMMDDELRPCKNPAIAVVRFADSSMLHVCEEHMPDWMKDIRNNWKGNKS